MSQAGNPMNIEALRNLINSLPREQIAPLLESLGNLGIEGNIPGGVASVANKQMGMQQQLNMGMLKSIQMQQKSDLGRETLDYRERLKQSAIERQRAETRSTFNTGMQALTTSRNPSDPVITESITLLSGDKMSPEAKLLGKELLKRQMQVASALSEKFIRENGEKMRTAGVKMTPEEIRNEFITKGSAQPLLTQRTEVASRARADARAGRRVRVATKKHVAMYKLEPEVADKVIGSVPEGMKVGDVPKFVAKEVLKYKTSLPERAIKKGYKGMGGLYGLAPAALVGYLASKWMGDKPSGGGQQVPPEIQMMLAQQMGKAGDGGSDSAGAGRELMNMSRALNVIKMMQQMQGMMGAAPQTDVARLL